jgi:hypothetical protein
MLSSVTGGWLVGWVIDRARAAILRADAVR